MKVRFAGLHHGGVYNGSIPGHTWPWPVGEVREVEDKAAARLLTDFAGLGPVDGKKKSDAFTKATAAEIKEAEEAAKKAPEQ